MLIRKQIGILRARAVSRLLSRRDTAAECQLFLALAHCIARPVTSLMNEIRLPRSKYAEGCVSGLPPQFPRQYADVEERRGTTFSIRVCAHRARFADSLPGIPSTKFPVRIKGRTCTQKVPSGK